MKAFGPRVGLWFGRADTATTPRQDLARSLVRQASLRVDRRLELALPPLRAYATPLFEALQEAR